MAKLLPATSLRRRQPRLWHAYSRETADKHLPNFPFSTESDLYSQGQSPEGPTERGSPDGSPTQAAGQEGGGRVSCASKDPAFKDKDLGLWVD